VSGETDFPKTELEAACAPTRNRIACGGVYSRRPRPPVSAAVGQRALSEEIRIKRGHGAHRVNIGRLGADVLAVGAIPERQSATS